MSALAALAALGFAAGGLAAGGHAACPLCPDETGVALSAATGTQGGADLAELTLRPVWDGELGEEGPRYRLSGRLRFDAADDLTPGAPPLGGYDPLSRPTALGDRGEAEIRDAYLDVDLGPASLRLGKQQLVWGKLYGLRLLDAVNPQSLRSFILEDFDEARIGLWGAKLSARLPQAVPGDWRAELFASPDSTVHRIPRDGATFAPRAPRYRFGVEGSTGEALPVVRPNDGVVGLRLAGFAAGLDLSLVALSRPDPEPIPVLIAGPDGPSLARGHAQRRLFGASGAGSAGPVSYRTEIGYSPGRRFPALTTEGLPVAASADQITVAVALDWAAPLDTTVSAQILHDRLLDAPPSLVRPERETYATLTVQRRFLDERLKAAVSLLARDGWSDRLVRPSLAYTRDDGTVLRLEADLFSGAPADVFGQFEESSRLMITVSRVFDRPGG